MSQVIVETAMKIRPIWHLLLICALSGCLDPYPTSDIGENVDALVIDGFINTSDQSAIIKLSKTLPLDTTATPDVVNDAEVTIQTEDGSSFSLPGEGNGQYQASSLSINFNTRYRLSIVLPSGASYLSDYIDLMQTPEIDSVTFGEGRDGINIYVNTHDHTGNSQYYKWDYVETWEYVASFFSNYKLVDGQAYDRTTQERIYNCWSTNESTKINVGNTVRLSDDVISNFLIASQAAGSSQLSKKYSINVFQRSLSKEEYDFWESLRKTTETVGGLFDAMPYAVTGNIHAVNGNGIAIGYFGGGEVKEKRIFIGLADLPYSVVSKSKRAPCNQDDMRSTDLAGLPNLSSSSDVLVDAIYVPFIGIVGYTYTSTSCADCRTYGGTNVMPEFWEE